MKDRDIPGTVSASHPVSRYVKIHFPDIPPIKMANPASRKGPVGPFNWQFRLELYHE